jgi:hypothetical protein
MMSGLPALPSATITTVTHPDIGLQHAPVVEDHAPVMTRSGVPSARVATLAHRFADHLAAHRTRPRRRPGTQIVRHFDEHVGVGQADTVAPGRTVQAQVVLAAQLSQDVASRAEGRAAHLRPAGVPVRCDARR